MRILSLLISLLLCSSPLLGQKPYFQQRVNFMIDAKLDDANHTLSGKVAMEYHNNSPDQLDKIYIHLWANAFQDRNTAFNRQKIRQGSNRFYFADEKDLGNYSELAFTVDGVGATLTLETDNPDIGILTLPQPLASGSKILIETPFTLKIPASFSRLGHVGESYQMTQWYPKPAVYDRDGWHAMPYLDMGEYYSEFGNYEVNITLPDNYIVGATGQLATASEKIFLEEQIKKSNAVLQDTLPSDTAFPASSTTYKTITYQAANVHDFAWFADKRFYVQKSQVTLSNDKQVDTYVYFTNQEGELWKKAIEYVDRSVLFYSQHVGNYPWPQATALQSALSAGGGMEYPMITVIGLSGDAKSLDAVITHEVGHNWFYGILGFNERDYPWLDEGINSYYDHRYLEQYYGSVDLDFLPEFLTKKTDYTTLQLGYLLQARQRADQAPHTHSDDYQPINYWIGAYEKPAVVLGYLEKYLGTATYDDVMQSFYQAWEFKHPGPDDFRMHVEKEVGKKLDWFFDGFIYSNDQLDYALSGLSQAGETWQVTAQNKGDIAAPFPVDAIKDDKVVRSLWVEGFTGKKEIEFPAGDYDYLTIDYDKRGIDVNRKNNQQKVSKAPGVLGFNLLGGIEHSTKSHINFIPTISWNNYDKTMLGLAIYNKFIPDKKFEFALAPSYSLVTKKLRGVGELQYNIYPKGKIKKISLGVSGRSFAHSYNWPNEFYMDHYKIAPSIQVDLGTKRENSSIEHSIKYRPVFLGEESANFTRDTITNVTSYTGNEREMTLVHHLLYQFENHKGVNPWGMAIDVRQSNYETFRGDASYFRASLSWNGEYTYDRGRAVKVRFYLGSILNNTEETSSNEYDGVSRAVRGTLNFSGQGYNDELRDKIYFGRSENNGIFSQQIHTDEGGFKNAFGSPFGLGRSNKFLFTVNLTGDLPQDLPLDLPLKPYLDIGYFKDASTIGEGATFDDQLLWSFGLSLTWINDRVGIYFPIVSSKNISNLYPERGNYFARITYKVDLNKLNPFYLMDHLSF